MRVLPFIVSALLWLGCRREETDMPERKKADGWIDQPDVLSVAFHPRREFPSRPSGFDVLAIPVAAGVTIGGRFYSAGTNAPTILFFHGNGEIVADYHELAPVYRSRGINFMPVDYRGYGLSTGTPTITAMLADAKAICAFAKAWLRDRGYAGRFVVMGRSLGSASALELASAHGGEIDGLIIESGFAHLVPLLTRLGASMPEGVDVEDSAVGQIAKMGAYSGPTLILHGAEDFIIPIRDAEDLYRAAPGTNKRLLRIEGAGHNDIMAVGHQEYFDAVGALAFGR
jgi:pimeloyl-ACP methyl ester carboxylesterase